MGTKEEETYNNGEQVIITNDKEFYPAGNDTVFKKLFVDNPDLLKQFISDVLSIPVEEIGELVIKNPELPPSGATGKMCRLDIYIVAGGRKLNVEMQAKRYEDYENRSLYYWADIYVRDVEKGAKYEDVPKTIAINILDFKLFEWEKEHSCFLVMEKDEHVLLTDKLEIHFFELPKVDDARPLRGQGELWLRMLKAKSEEELNMLKTENNPYINKGIEQIMNMNADEKFKEYLREREKWERDYYAGLSYAKKQGMELGRAEGVELGYMQKLMEQVERKLAKGKSAEVIAEELDEKLSVVQEVIEKLRLSEKLNSTCKVKFHTDD